MTSASTTTSSTPSNKHVTPGSSALFLLSSDAVMDKVVDAFHAEHPRLVQTNLSTEEEAKLRAVFGDED